MTLYHRTTPEKARSILANGFRDHVAETETDVETRQDFAGVWLAESPPQGGDALLRITLDMTPEELAEYEWRPHDRPSREWLVPAAMITAYGKVEVLEGV